MSYTVKKPVLDLFPKSWNSFILNGKTDLHIYPNLESFKYHVKTLTQESDDNCNIAYKDALKELLTNQSTLSKGDYQIIKNRVKNNLLKRGLISDTVYESYKYDIDGVMVDVNKVIERDPQCFLKPNASYKEYFYELYISVSYPYTVTNKEVQENMAKILATVELLQLEHIYTKITLVLSIRDISVDTNFFSVIPLFSHKEHKTIEKMSSVLNARLLRKFYFAIVEDKYKDDLSSNYGLAVDLPKVITPVDLDECELASSILEQVIVGG